MKPALPFQSHRQELQSDHQREEDKEERGEGRRGDPPGPAKEKIPQGSPVRLDRGANLALHRRQIYHQMNPEAAQSPLPLPGAGSLVSTGLPLKTHRVPDSRAEGARRVPGVWENRESESEASRSETRVIWQLNARDRNRAGASPVGTQAE